MTEPLTGSTAVPALPMLTWLLTYAFHSTLLLGAAWALDRTRLVEATAGREWLWRLALLGGLFTATFQTQLLGPAGPSPERPPPPVDAPALPAEVPVSAARAAGPRPVPPPVASEPPPHGSTSGGTDAARPAAIAPGRVTLPVGHWAPPLVVAWLAVALVLLLRLGAAAWKGHATLRHRTPVTAGPAQAALGRVVARVGGSRPAFSEADIASPVCLLSGEICIPRWAAEQLDQSELDAMLAHELAHARRRDPLWRTLALTVGCLGFFQPLNRIATRRLDHLAELACDAVAARRVGARPLARCLERFVARMVAEPAPPLAATMARRAGGVVDRVSRLVSGAAERPVTIDWRARIASLGAVLLVASATPAITLRDAVAAPEAPRAPTSIHVRDDGGGRTEATFSLSDHRYRLSVEIDGHVEYAADDSDVVAMSRGDLLRISELDGDQRIEIELRGRRDGIERELRIDGDEVPWGDGGAGHLARLLPTLFRELGIDAERRVARLLANGGPGRVIDEIALIRSDHGTANYAEHLVRAAGLSDDELDDLLAALGSVGSDFELRRALDAIIATQRLDEHRVAAILEAGSAIGSDFETRQLLDGLAPRLTGDARRAIEVYLGMAARIGSDFEQRQAFEALLAVDGLRNEDLAAVLAAAAGIGSDFELRQLLEAAASAVAADAALVRAYLATAATIGSSVERRAVIEALVATGDLEPEVIPEVLAGAASISSDFEAAETLIAIARYLPDDAAVLRAYGDAVESIGSSHERERARRAARMGDRTR